MPKGDCFQVALQLAEAGRNDPTVRVCHGQPISRHPDNPGRRYWHAWVELNSPAGPVVLDWSNDLPQRTLRRASYYRNGHIDPEQVLRYTFAEATTESLRTATYGPWVDGWKDATDEHGQAVL